MVPPISVYPAPRTDQFAPNERVRGAMAMVPSGAELLVTP